MWKGAFSGDEVALGEGLQHKGQGLRQVQAGWTEGICGQGKWGPQLSSSGMGGWGQSDRV